MSEPVCPYCRMPFGEAGLVKVFCPACGTPHHEDCYRENGGCTVFGCSRAPADDPKLQVSHSDLSAVSRPSQPYVPAAQPYAAVQQGPVSRSPYGSSPLGLSQAAAPAPAPSAASPATENVPPAPAPTIQPPPGTYFYSQPTSPLSTYVPPAAAVALATAQRKSRTTYIVLGIFLGGLGVHNFYAGYTGRAVGQLCLTILTLGYLWIASELWAIVEICIVNKDANGIFLN